MAGGSTVGSKKDGRRRKRRDPDPVMEPDEASDIRMLT